MNLNHLNQIEGVQFMPVRGDKRPIHNNWQEVKTKYDLSNCEAVGIVCGILSNNIEAIDFDLKYDVSGTLMNDYIKAVNDINPDIIRNLVVQRTRSGGYHIIYRCEQIEGNQKLANRASTIEEKNKTYADTFEKKRAEMYSVNNVAGKTDDQIFTESSIIAKKSSDNDKVRVLIETRGERGYIACAPTLGYEIIQGSFESIPFISQEDRSVLFSVAYSFNSYFKHQQDRPQVNEQRKNFTGLTPSEDFDKRGDVVGLLRNHGWTVVGRQGSKVMVRRPGDTSAKTSGNFDEERNWFSVFSTSTEFESQKPYKPYAVFCMLECNGDYTQVTKKLADLGYGTPLESIKKQQVEIPSSIDMTDDEDLSFLATDEDFDDYINKWRAGTFEMGLKTGMPDYDYHFRFKKGNLVIINGIDNVGKSTVIWYKLFLVALMHDWRGVVFSSENRVGSIKKKIMEFFWCKSIKNFTDEEYKIASSFFKDHFQVIKNAKELYNYRDIMNMTSKVINKNPIDFLLIDPYNSLKVQGKNSYDYHYEAASVLKLFGEQNNLSIFLNVHVGTSAARNKDKDGYTLAPGKEDSEMGVMFANKADEFITIHRLTDHSTDFMYTEIHVRKVKETETGGRPTPKFKPLILRSLEGLVGFINIKEKSISAQGVNPVLTYKENKDNIQKYDLLKSKSIVEDLPPVIQGDDSEEDIF